MSAVTAEDGAFGTTGVLVEPSAPSSQLRALQPREPGRARAGKQSARISFRRRGFRAESSRLPLRPVLRRPPSVSGPSLPLAHSSLLHSPPRLPSRVVWRECAANVERVPAGARPGVISLPH